MGLFKVPKRSREEKLPRLSPAQRGELDRIEPKSMASCKGQINEFESALGLLG